MWLTFKFEIRVSANQGSVDICIGRDDCYELLQKSRKFFHAQIWFFAVFFLIL